MLCQTKTDTVQQTASMDFMNTRNPSISGLLDGSCLRLERTQERALGGTIQLSKWPLLGGKGHFEENPFVFRDGIGIG